MSRGRHLLDAIFGSAKSSDALELAFVRARVRACVRVARNVVYVCEHIWVFFQVMVMGPLFMNIVQVGHNHARMLACTRTT